MPSDTQSQGSYAYYSFPATPNRSSPPASSRKSTSPESARTTRSNSTAMAPSPAAGKAPKLPSTPTKSGRNPASNTTPKLGQAGDKAKGASKTPQSSAKGAAGSAKKLGPKSTDSPKLPPRPKGGDDAASKAKDTAGKASDAKDKGEEATEDAGQKINLKDNDQTEGEDEPQGKVSQLGNETGEGESSAGDLESAAPEPMDDDDDEGDVTDTADAAKETAQDTGEDAGSEAEDESTTGKVTGGLSKAGKGAAGKAAGAKDTASKAGGKAAQGDAQGAAGDAAGDVKESVEDTAEDAQDTAGDVKDGAEDAAEGAKDTAGDAVEGAKDTAEDATEGAKDTAEDTTEGAKDTAEGAVDTAKDAAPEEAGDAVDGAKDKAEDATEGAKDEAEDATEGAKDTAEDATEGAKDTAEGAADTAKDAAPEEAGDAVDGAKDTAEDAADQLPDLSILKGLEIGEGGKILGEDGNPIGEVSEGNPEDLVGHEVGDNGEVLDEDGDLVGRVKTLPKEAEDAAEDTADKAKEEAETYLPDLDILKGLEVTESGEIFDKEGNVVGKITEGDAEQLAGQTLNDEGEVLDEDGDAIGRAETVPQPVKEAADEAQDAIPDIGVLDGMKVGDDGQVLDQEGNPIGKLSEGEAKDLAGQTINDKGEILNDDGEVVGRAEALPQDAKDAAEGAADEAKQNIPDISALEGLEVGEDGNIIGPDGNVLGKITEGDPADLIGQKLNAEGEVLDDDGDAIGRAEVVPQEAKDAADGITPDLSIIEGKKVNKKGKILDEEGETLAQLTEDSDLKQCVGKTPNEKGEILNDKGEVIGKVEIVPGEAVDEAMKDLHPELLEETKQAAEDAKEAAENIPDFSIVEGLKVNKKGEVLNEDGEPIAKLSEGELSDVSGKKINDKGEILDKDGNVVGKVELIPQEGEGEGEGEEEEEEAGEELPPLSILEGYKVNKSGYIVDEDGNPIGKLVEGDAKKLSKSGVECDAEGQFWDNKGNVIGRAETLPKDDKEGEDAPFAGLEGLIVVKDGWVEDENSNRVGQLVEGDAKKLVGRAVDEDGDVIDKRGNVVGHAERYEEPDEEEPEKADLSILSGLTCNKQGNVIGNEGVPIATLVEGNPKELAGRKIDGEGQIWNDAGKVVGRCELIPEDQRPAKPEGPFAGLEGLVVVKGGMVEDEDGNTVGQVVDGDAKRLVGRAVDEDGDIVDKYGNVKGHAEPYEEPDEEQADLSSLAGKTVNKVGNVVDEHGTIFGRISSGDPKKLAGKKVDGEGQIWSDDGKVIGQAELIPGGEQDQKTEGPFSGFENLVVGKDGMVQDSAGQIVGRLTEGDPKKLLGRKVDDDGDILDKSGNSIGKAERWEPEEKKRDINPMSGRKVNKEGEVRDEDGNIIGRLTAGNLQTLIGKEVDDNGYVVDNDGNKVGECTLIENIQDDEGPTEEELEEQRKREENAEIAKKMIYILKETLDKVQPICKQITEIVERADRTPKDELDEEKLVQDVKPLLEEGGKILQECNGAIRGLDPDGSVAATAKQRAASGDATKEEHQLAELLKELTTTVVKTIDNGKKRIQDMPHAKKKLNPLWGLLSEPLFQIIAAVGLLLSGVLGLVGKLLNGLGLGGLVNGLLGGLGIDKLLGGLGLGSLTEAITGKKSK